jgi:hypothetical protein
MELDGSAIFDVSETDGGKSSSDSANASDATQSDADPIRAIRVVANRGIFPAFKFETNRTFHISFAGSRGRIGQATCHREKSHFHYPRSLCFLANRESTLLEIGATARDPAISVIKSLAGG